MEGRHDQAEPDPASDKLRRVAETAAFIGEPERRTLNLLQTGQLPAGKEGEQWVASRCRLRRHYAELTAA